MYHFFYQSKLNVIANNELIVENIHGQNIAQLNVIKLTNTIRTKIVHCDTYFTLK